MSEKENDDVVNKTGEWYGQAIKIFTPHQLAWLASNFVMIEGDIKYYGVPFPPVNADELKDLVDNGTITATYGEPKELVEPITERFQREVLKNIFGDEEITDLRYEEDESEYEIECVLRRKL